MKIRFDRDSMRPHWDFSEKDFAGRAFQMLREISPRERDTIGAYVAEEITLLTLIALEHFVKGKEIPAWVFVMLQEKEKGAGGYKGNYTLGAGVNILNEKLRWMPPTGNGNRYELVERAMIVAIEDMVIDKDWELRYPTMGKEGWQEGKDRVPMVRFIFGVEPDLYFADTEVDVSKPTQFDSVFLEDLVGGRVPGVVKKPQPLKRWFQEPRTLDSEKARVPTLAIWINSHATTARLPIRDPRMNILTINVNDSTDQKNRVLPETIMGQFAHMITDGEPAKMRIRRLWDNLLSTEKNGGVQELRSNNRAFLDSTEKGKIEPPHNPFREVAFMNEGCKLMASVLEEDELLDADEIGKYEMKSLLSACKKLNIKVNTLFSMSLLALTGFSPVAAVAPEQKSYFETVQNGDKKKVKTKRTNRIEIATFGRRLYQESMLLRRLSRWVRDPQQQLFLDEVLSEHSGELRKLKTQADKSAHTYQDQIKMASESRGVVTYTALVAQNNRDLLEKLTQKLVGHMRAAMNPIAQFSSLGSVPEIGEPDSLDWFFESAFSKTVGRTVGMLGNEVVTGSFLDDTSLLFNSCLDYLTKDDIFLPDRILMSGTGFLNLEVRQWLTAINKNRISRLGRAINLNEVPITINGITYPNIYNAAAKAGGDAEKMEHLFAFQDQVIAAVARVINKNPRSNDKSQYKHRVKEHTAKFTHDLLLMADTLAYTLLVGSGHKESSEAATLGGMINVRKAEQKKRAGLVSAYQG